MYSLEQFDPYRACMAKADYEEIVRYLDIKAENMQYIMEKLLHIRTMLAANLGHLPENQQAWFMRPISVDAFHFHAIFAAAIVKGLLFDMTHAPWMFCTCTDILFSNNELSREVGTPTGFIGRYVNDVVVELYDRSREREKNGMPARVLEVDETIGSMVSAFDCEIRHGFDHICWSKHGGGYVDPYLDEWGVQDNHGCEYYLHLKRDPFSFMQTPTYPQRRWTMFHKKMLSDPEITLMEFAINSHEELFDFGNIYNSEEFPRLWCRPFGNLLFHIAYMYPFDPAAGSLWKKWLTEFPTMDIDDESVNELLLSVNDQAVQEGGCGLMYYYPGWFRITDRPKQTCSFCGAMLPCISLIQTNNEDVRLCCNSCAEDLRNAHNDSGKFELSFVPDRCLSCFAGLCPHKQRWLQQGYQCASTMRQRVIADPADLYGVLQSDAIL